MKRWMLVLAIAFAFSATAEAIDIAISTQANWWSQSAADREAQEIVNAVTTVPVELFDATQHGALADWVQAHIGDGQPDLLMLCGQCPATIYEPGNAQPDGSLAEEFLDDGNCIINTGDWIFYVVNGAGTNGSAALPNIMDISSMEMWDDNLAVTVTGAGRQYTPSLQDFQTDRAIHIDSLENDWFAELILAIADDGNRAEPCVIRNSYTGGRIGVFYQTASQDDDPRGEVISEWINNWYLPIAAVGDVSAMTPVPRSESVLEATATTLEWRAGANAASHNVYFGESFDEVSEGLMEAISTTEASLSTNAIGGYEGGLTPGQTYYWRVDEVGADGTVYAGEVWSFTVQPLIAWSPAPTDGANYIVPDQELTWNAGLGALFHVLYLGEDFDDVNDATMATATAQIADAAYVPTLEPGKTYYWRVDEFAGPMSVHKGEVWSFTTLPEITVSDPDLVGWWTMDEGMGTNVLDWSGHGYHGTFVGNIQWADGYHGAALKFGGVGQYVDCGEDAADEVTSDFTLAAWAKMDPGTANHYGGIGGKLMYDGTNYFGFSLVRHSSNVYRLWVGDGTSDLAKTAVNSDFEYTDTEWHHVVGVRQGQTNSLYIDGVKQAATSTSGFSPSSQFFHIGRQYSTQTDRNFLGIVDDLRVYSKALTESQIADVMRGDPLLASAPSPYSGATVDIRDATSLSWVAGETAASHDVYLGTNRSEVLNADTSSPEYQGNRLTTSLSLNGLVEFGGGTYYWRVDEVEAGGSVQKGYIWSFTVPAHLIVDDFESYDNNVGSRVFETWIDGYGYTQPEPGNPGNGTGAAAGHDIWSADSGYTYLMETGNTHSGQALPVYYDNSAGPYYSEVVRTWTTAQNWTTGGVTDLTLWVRGKLDNAAAPLYVILQDSANRSATMTHDTAVTAEDWVEWSMPLSDFTGVSPTSVKKMTIGVGNRTAPSVGGSGVVFVDDIVVE